MKLSDAAAQWLQAKADQKDAERRLNEAKAVLLDHFRKSGRASYAGKVGYSTTTYRQLVADKARALLGERAVEAEEVKTRETLTALG